jgi:hypothetical protein
MNLAMDTKASSLVIAIIILVLLAGMAQGQHTYPKVGNYLTDLLNPEDYELLSKWDVLVLHRLTPEWTPEALPTLRSLNPDIKILTYFPVAAIWADYDSMDEAARLYGDKAAVSDWWLYDTKGNPVRNPDGSTFINFSSKCPLDGSGNSVDEWLAEHVANQLILDGPWDGILLDIFFDNAWWINNMDWFEDPPAMLDLDRDGTADCSDSIHVWWRSSILSFLGNLRQRIDWSYIIVGNGKHCLSDYLNGGIRENFPYMHGGWEENMLSDYGYLTLCSELLDYPMSCVMMLCYWRDDGNTLYQPRRTGSYERFLRYTLCSALLGDGYYFLNGGTWSLWWDDYYDLDLGVPTSDAYMDSLWNNIYDCYSWVWRRDFENASVYCNPYDQYIGFDGGWLRPQDGLILTHGIPSSVEVSIIPAGDEEPVFDQGDRFINYRISIDNHAESAVFADVWASLSDQDACLVSSTSLRYLVGAQDTIVRNRMLRVPPNLRPGTYCLEVMVGEDGHAEVDRDSIMVTRVVGFDKEQMKKGDDVEGLSVTVYPQPAVLGGGDLSLEVKGTDRSGGFCSVRMYDVTGRLVNTAFEDRIDGEVDLVVALEQADGDPLAPGVYVISVHLEDKAAVRKVVLLRR